MRAVLKKQYRQDEPGFSRCPVEREPPVPPRAKYLAIISMDRESPAGLADDEARVVSVLKSHPKSEKMRPYERERLADEIMGVLEQLEGEERDIAAKLFMLVFGAEKDIPPEYRDAVSEIVSATGAEKDAAKETDTISETNVQRPFMIAQFSREIRQSARYYRAVPELEDGIEGMDDDIQYLARAALKTLFGKGGQKETLDALILLEWIPSKIIDEYGPPGAILEACELWQKIRKETNADDETALAGICALGVILDDEIKPTNMASCIIDNLSINLEDVHTGIVEAIKLTQA